MKLKDILKAKGWSDEQITTALADPNLVATLDEVFGTITSERDTLKATNAEWQRKLDEEFNPAVSKAEKEAAQARRIAADAQEQLKIAKDYGYLPAEADQRLADAAAAAAARNDPNSYDSKRHPDWSDVAKLADAEGNAIAMMADISEEYRMLTGKPLYEYETTINGQKMRGASALREEAKVARKQFDQYVREKLGFDGLHQKRIDAQQKERDDRITKEAEERIRREYADKFGNPALAQPTPSRQPFIPAKRTDGKQPWDVPAQERRVNRLKHAMEVQMKSQAVN